MNKEITALQEKARTNHIPIITDDGLAFLLDIIKERKIKDVLEIGSAVGYSAINMALLAEKVDTFERDQEMLDELKKNISAFNLSDKITVYPYDALLYSGVLGTYDLIFIDAAKAQYQKFFLKYSKYLRDDGIIICDNLNFHHLKEAEVSRRTKQLLKKIKQFKDFLISNKEYDTNIYDIGDGMSVSKRK